MKEHLVYLAGPMTGLHFEEASKWREEIAELLKDFNIRCLSPLRHKVHLEKRILGFCDDHPLTSQKGVVARDFFDCCRSDIVIANLLDVKRISIGTCFEVAWCFQNHKPLIVIMEKNGRYDHPFILEAAGFTVKNIKEAAEIARSIL